ncbi:MAG: chemotaxis protein CheX [Candidatus Riflebacteria bacterium]|nr:chemotaxis protein CheX [Candidatus Riflebacteria bacterium]
MDVNILNQFILAASSVFEQVANLKLKKEKVNIFEHGTKVIADVATLIGITGKVKGQMVVTLTSNTAMKFASAIMMGEPVNEYNELAESGVCEMANMIGGDAAQRLNALGYTVDVAVPSIIRGNAVEISFQPNTPIFMVAFSSEWGPIEVVLRIEVMP